MQLPVIYLIRHGEKPTPDENGFTRNGKPSDDSLTKRGWDRAEALVTYFGAAPGTSARAPLQTPATLFACGPHSGPSKDVSHRERETATPLAEALGVDTVTKYGKEEEAQAALAARSSAGPVLMVWESQSYHPLDQAIYGEFRRSLALAG